VKYALSAANGEVAGQHQAEPEPGCSPAHARNHGFWHAPHAKDDAVNLVHEILEQRRPLRRGAVLDQPEEPFEIAAGHEMIAAANDHASDGAVVLGAGYCVPQAQHEIAVERIERGRTVERDDTDAVLGIRPYDRFAHNVLAPRNQHGRRPINPWKLARTESDPAEPQRSGWQVSLRTALPTPRQLLAARHGSLREIEAKSPRMLVLRRHRSTARNYDLQSRISSSRAPLLQ
jgi:hypothetical protein